MIQKVGATPGRLAYLDAARGLYVLWMVIGHSLVLAGIPDSHWMQHLRPAGWATTGFVMLAGFGVAVLKVGRTESVAATWPVLWWRAAQIAVVAWASNLLSTLLVASSHGGITAQRLVAVLAFQTPWSISGILVPIALVVFAAPGLLALERRFGPVGTLVFAMAINGLLLSQLRVSESWTLRELAAATGPFRFPVLQLAALGILGFAVGSLAARRGATALRWAVPAGAACAGVLLLVPGYYGPLAFVPDGAKLGVVLCGAIILTRLSFVTTISVSLSLLGRAAMLVFLGHRLLLHVGRALFRGVAVPEYLAGALIAFGVLTSLGIAAFRVHSSLAPRLKTVGL